VQIVNGTVSDDFNAVWNLPPVVTIPVSGTITVTATAADPGAILAEPNTVTNIQTPVPGWQTVTNPAAAFPGLPLETDVTLRKRQARSTAARSPRSGDDAAIARSPGSGSKVYQNDTLPRQQHLRRPIAVVVEGGDAQTIGETIAEEERRRGTCGSTEVVDRRSWEPLRVDFFYLTEVKTFVSIAVDPLPGYVNTTAGLISAAVARYISDLDIGEDVYQARLYSPANLAGDDAAMAATGLPQATLDKLSDTYVVRYIRLGIAASPGAGRHRDPVQRCRDL
jgi:hypothetical protein